MPNPAPDHDLVAAIDKNLLPVPETGWAGHPLVAAAAADKKFVLIGEATHGTADFYRLRAEVTQYLIAEKGFDAVAVEADWPDAYRVNRYVSHRSDDSNANAALADFERFPAWMWRNTEVLDFSGQLRSFNETHKAAPVGFYGLDLYSMTTSIQAVLDYLDRIDPPAAAAARERYACFGQFINNPQAYGYAALAGVLDSCEEAVIAQITALQQKARLYIERDGFFAGDDYFSAQQNARLVKGAEEYYRALYRGHPNTWNLRDRHMFTTLEKLAEHLERRLGRKAKIVVWAHNSHLGNAAATDMKKRGEINLGQLVQENYPDNSLRIGFSTSRGAVTAASDWDGPAETKTVQEPLPGSYEQTFSRVKEPRFILDLRERNEAVDLLREERLQRAIGVIYRPETERQSHYFYSCLPQQFDFMIHIDETQALEPLPTFVHERPGEMDETYPYGL